MRLIYPSVLLEKRNSSWALADEAILTARRASVEWMARKSTRKEWKGKTEKAGKAGGRKSRLSARPRTFCSLYSVPIKKWFLRWFTGGSNWITNLVSLKELSAELDSLINYADREYMLLTSARFSYMYSYMQNYIYVTTFWLGGEIGRV